MNNQDNQTDSGSNRAAPENMSMDADSAQLKKEIINNSVIYAGRGTKTHKVVGEGISNEPSEYDMWQNQGSYEANSWSVGYWKFKDNTWKIQATRVELKPDGRSQMISYSMRVDDDPSFPGFQVYKELIDDKYNPAKIEDIVYLDRVMRGLIGV